ncbi:glycerol-3-phosphate phosphatase-like [Mizuhopecten yessoensis]|uniref:Phosphoglycolate phosphatase n=1 Tax=Mizuhopecten yessoensis TaxID=6573 RepID=A0A210QFF6_MIZYE|nr:glycerol-3-phosphate phosphatase-like [Mizuhopecten yessoensis]OWF47493.1 Phosphoglycolate phosphatase [Mizuhopecten yessoensis]
MLSRLTIGRICWELAAQCKSWTGLVAYNRPAGARHSRPFTTDASNVRHLTQNNLDHFLQSYDTFMLDCDGTLYGTDHVTEIPNVPEAIYKLRTIGKHLLFVTNNSMHSNERYVNKFKEVGFEANESDIFGVANAAAVYLRHIAKVEGKVYVVGGQGMKQELDKYRLESFGAGPDPDQASWDPKQLLQMEFRDNVQAVLVGFDEHFHYNKIFKALSYLRDPKCLYVATNVVETAVKIGSGRVQPTTGALIQAISVPAKREPLVVGKPGTLLLDCIRHKHPDIDLSRTVFIGDGLRSDIAFANNIGVDSVLVLTGSGALDKIDGPDVKPTYVMDSFELFSKI